jgi:Bardet-Biedl syndrome 7 protein
MRLRRGTRTEWERGREGESKRMHAGADAARCACCSMLMPACVRSTLDMHLSLRFRPLNTLSISGSFTLLDIHSWVMFCLPDVSSKLASSSEGVQQLYFRSTFLRTVLVCEYEKGRATFRSDSITAVSILKEVITKEATSKKINIAVDVDLRIESVSSFLHLLRPELDAHFTLNKKNSFIAPLKEIATHEMGGLGNGGGAGTGAAAGGILANLDQLAAFLQPSYIDILAHSEEIEAKFKAAPRHLDFLRGIVTDLFVDQHKLQGKSAQSRVPLLLEILENYEFEKLLQAFKD